MRLAIRAFTEDSNEIIKYCFVFLSTVVYSTRQYDTKYVLSPQSSCTPPTILP